jgi:pyridoxal phosphate enzyme (YggS family)
MGQGPFNEVPALEQIESNLRRLREQMARAAAGAGRAAGDVALMAVTKYVGPEIVRLLHKAGLRDFGENTVQQGCAKRQALADLEGARWHLIGHLQRNKVSRALESFHSIHSVDSERLLAEIGLQASRRSLPAPPLYIEVNVSREPRKTGLPEEALRGLLRFVGQENSLPRDCVKGLMTMAPYSTDAEEARPWFRRLRELRDSLVREGLIPEGAGLSMGMSGDFAVAIAEGATVIRIGSYLVEGLKLPCPS